MIDPSSACVVPLVFTSNSGLFSAELLEQLDLMTSEDAGHDPLLSDTNNIDNSSDDFPLHRDASASPEISPQSVHTDTMAKMDTAKPTLPPKVDEVEEEEESPDKNAEEFAEEEEEEGDETFEVEKILTHRCEGKGAQPTVFLIKWKGYNQDSNSWEPRENLSCANILNDYLTTHGFQSTGRSLRPPKISSKSSWKKSAARKEKKPPRAKKQVSKRSHKKKQPVEEQVVSELVQTRYSPRKSARGVRVKSVNTPKARISSPKKPAVVAEENDSMADLAVYISIPEVVGQQTPVIDAQQPQTIDATAPFDKYYDGVLETAFDGAFYLAYNSAVPNVMTMFRHGEPIPWMGEIMGEVFEVDSLNLVLNNRLQ